MNTVFQKILICEQTRDSKGTTVPLAGSLKDGVLQEMQPFYDKSYLIDERVLSLDEG